ncbi:MAG: hypothetical protein GX033_06995, partial [Firmicutes bacterium]|nr:hypothetical protein [Bacillota bacterium]
MAIRLRTGHTHGLARFTTVDRDHRHLVLNITDRAVVRSDGSHVHRVRSLTSFDRRHAHAVNRFTGPGIPIRGTGMHYPILNARTTRTLAPRHRLRARPRRAPNIP